MKDTSDPLVDLRYSHIEKAPQPDYFYLYFSSDISLDSILSRSKGISRASEGLECSLEQPAVFEMNHVIASFGAGHLDRDGSVDGRFMYKANFFFGETADEGGTYRYLRRERLVELLGARSSIPCKVKISALGYKAYYSKSFSLPMAEVLPLVLE
ncbi:hypothetical protein HNP46_005449 [Pseudomonas nitritireducens]|uniref:Uncharacterized protein n=1 Tax=Pseudomonas nitroreducens TaxID=46680 RepID=A0A7W7KQ82_PSENT|nr:hypothetical protein [Pseudomonas nitritireducens]MBB4866544.1 hypothetical protein [Pseudomonas nitritireducens]